MMMDSSKGKPSQKALFFYEYNEPYYEFTNFFAAPIKVDGRRWAMTEAYFQGMKFDKWMMRDMILSLPWTELLEFRDVTRKFRLPHWTKEVRTQAMERVLVLRSQQHAVYDTLYESWGYSNEIEFVRGCIKRWQGQGINKLSYTRRIPSFFNLFIAF
jgi:predicted NAD-dependent protein-ADP-ribosyltransferase YbiA (DUF1768 family)